MISVIALWAAVMLAGIRWLRVAQREHYIPGCVFGFAVAWRRAHPASLMLWLGALIAALLSTRVPMVGVGVAFVIAVGPVGLGLRGRTSCLRWTARARRVAASYLFLCTLAFAVVRPAGTFASCVLALLLDLFLMDLALTIVKPVEKRASKKFMDSATRTLNEVAPLVVAITGSYGKTTTKEYVRHLLSGRYAVVSSPGSFNNALGLARTINEHLTPGTEILVAEMGMYGRGEIAALCAWLRPKVSVITAVGPVHLTRLRTLDAVADAKGEVLVGSQIAVVNDDDPLIREQVRRRASGKVLRCSRTDEGAEVYVTTSSEGHRVSVDGVVLGNAPTDTHPLNVACAVGVAIALGVPGAALAASLRTLPEVDHRCQVAYGDSGVTILDDTYNSNPAGAASALERLARLGTGRRVVVTPGMVELGRSQATENRMFAAEASRVATDVIIVGRTNRRALLEGAQAGSASTRTVATRQQAVQWVRETLSESDAVLYENDLPDHYP